MKNYSKRLGGWVTALKRRLFFNAGLKLTALYVLNAILILGAFAIISGYLQFQQLEEDLTGVFGRNIAVNALVHQIDSDLRSTTAMLIVFVVIAMGLLSYFFVRMTLRPLQNFVETQRRFISDASHELRTPLATVKTENEVALLEAEKLSREEAVSIIRSNVEEIDRISTILNNLLNLASFADASGDPPLSAVDLSGVANNVLKRMNTLAERKQIRLSAPGLAPILAWGNPTALEEVISNLLKNAIQYTPSGGEVVLRVRPRPKERQVELVVQDTGVGIPDKDLPYIFEPFYRSDKSLHMYHQGNGLGLPLVKQIVNRHNGSIDIQSTLGKGTVVTVLIPMAPAEVGSS